MTATAAPDLRHLASRWPVPGPWRVRATAPSLANANCVVDARDATYILRVYGEPRVATVEHEHAVLAALQSQEPPFRVPAPVRTVAGGTHTVVEYGGKETLASLAPLLPGGHPGSTSVNQIEAVGRGLARLTRAFGAVGTLPVPSTFPPYGEFHRLHPAEADPRAAIEAIPVLDAPTKRRILAMLDRLDMEVPPLYATLPRQLAHRDFKPDNVLVDGAAISAVLDFEFAGQDLRVLDFAVGTYLFPRDLGGLGSWPMYAAIARGYAATGDLTADEAAAVPALMLLRIAAAVAYFVGRCGDGSHPWERAVPSIGRRAVRFLDWLGPNERVLVDLMQECATGGAADRPG